MPVERFLASLRFEQRGKLEQLGIEIDTLDWKQVNFGSSTIPSFSSKSFLVRVALGVHEPPEYDPKQFFFVYDSVQHKAKTGLFAGIKSWFSPLSF